VFRSGLRILISFIPIASGSFSEIFVNLWQRNHILCTFESNLTEMRFYKITLLFFLVLAAAMTQGQTPGFGSNVMASKDSAESPVVYFQPKVSLGLGTSFTTFSGASALSTWVMPQITMPVAKKWNASIGMGYSSIFYQGFSHSGGKQNHSQYAHLFVSGQYLLNKRVTLTGTAYKTMMLNPVTTGDVPRDGRLDFSNQGVMLDMNYKVTDQFEINVGVEYRQQNNPLYPGMQPGISSGFGDRMTGGSFVPYY
jgi:hypothetical protein